MDDFHYGSRPRLTADEFSELLNYPREILIQKLIERIHEIKKSSFMDMVECLEEDGYGAIGQTVNININPFISQFGLEIVDNQMQDTEDYELVMQVIKLCSGADSKKEMAHKLITKLGMERYLRLKDVNQAIESL